ncbi:hypothetical protein DYB34_010831 [Aphanomyces astaci]|uniref:Uncharacterized protein n=1 Tax=Aphanomyces astaci TaxID=112090 RepID=A0A418BEV3_APHAT|nr:hypothetical protein DYB34_010831 [Aphanomyces astaci]
MCMHRLPLLQYLLICRLHVPGTYILVSTNGRGATALTSSHCPLQLCMGALLRLQPEYLPKAHTPKSSANSCFVSGVFLGSLILWRREHHGKGSSIVGFKDAAPFELFGTTLIYDDIEDTEEVEPLVAADTASLKKAIQQQRRVPSSPSIQQL